MQHTQLFIRAEVRKPLLTVDLANDFMCRAVALAGMKVVAGPYSFEGVPGNEGISTIVGLDFSSASLHEWPIRKDAEYPLIHFDLYTCGEKPDLGVFADLFMELDPVSFGARTIDRESLFQDRSSSWSQYR